MDQQQAARVAVLGLDDQDAGGGEALAWEMSRKLLGWKHSGFSVHNGNSIDIRNSLCAELFVAYSHIAITPS